MRTPTVIGNWKMNGARAMASQLLQEVITQAKEVEGIELVVLPPFVYLDMTERLLAGTQIKWGAQNFYHQTSGAFTGEISANMLTDFNCQYVLVGHSERRTLFGESDHTVAQKYSTAIHADLIPIICVGETLDERKAGITKQIISCQLGTIFASPFGVESLMRAVIAYEPVWAIGTGLSAEPETAQEVHAYIRQLIAENAGKEIADGIRILYGGSVKLQNAAALFAMPDIDGGLIGGASLDANEFIGIAKLCKL